MKCRAFLPLLLLCALHGVPADLQAEAVKETVSPPPAEIVKVWCVTGKEDPAKDKESRDAQPAPLRGSPDNPCFVYHTLIIQVKNLKSWTSKHQLNPGQLLLVLNGIVLKGRLFGKPDGDSAGSEYTRLRFNLDRSRETARVEWRELMSRVKLAAPVGMSVGLAPASEPTAGTTFGPQRLFWGDKVLSIQPTSKRLFAFAALSYIGLLVFFVALARSSDLLRGPPSPDGRKPYSLGRVQMAWWFFIVIGSYIQLFIVLEDYNTLTAGVLSLIGISAATGFAGATIDATKKASAGEQLQETEALQKEQQALTTAMAELDTEISATPPPAKTAQLQADRTLKQQRLGDITARLAKLAARSPAASPPAAAAPLQVTKQNGFLRDILGGPGGVSIYRFQTVVWSVVLGVVFLSSVYMDLTMPDFDATLLGLMGISSGTYVGFKLPTAGGG